MKAILSNDNGETWKTISKIFDDLGYDWKYEILNAKDYGIPQNRERIFVVGFRKDLDINKFEFPQKIKLDKKMKDFLLDNVSGKYYLPKKGVDFVTSNKNLEKRYTQIDGDIQLCQKKNQQFNWHGDFVFEEENTNKEQLMLSLIHIFMSAYSYAKRDSTYEGYIPMLIKVDEILWECLIMNSDPDNDGADDYEFNSDNVANYRKQMLSLVLKNGKEVFEKYLSDRKSEAEDDEMDWEKEIIGTMKGGYDNCRFSSYWNSETNMTCLLYTSCILISIGKIILAEQMIV